MVPRTIDKEIILTLSWLGPEFQLNLIAETFIDTTEGIKAGENCVLSFGQPKCHGMQHLSSRDKSVLGETIRLNSNLFYNPDNTLIANKKVMIYVMDTAETKAKEISASNAQIGINLPTIGQLTTMNVPFKTAEEEARKDLQGIIPFNWAAFCLSVSHDEAKGADVLNIKRLNGLSVFRP